MTKYQTQKFNYIIFHYLKRSKKRGGFLKGGLEIVLTRDNSERKRRESFQMLTEEEREGKESFYILWRKKGEGLGQCKGKQVYNTVSNSTADQLTNTKH